MAFMDDLQGWIQGAAKQFGVSPKYLATTAQLESGTNPNAAGGGLFQFRGPAMIDVGLSNPLDPQASTFGAAQYAATNTAYLTNALGRAPQDWEVYLAHQQGAAGAATILTNPGQYASSGVSNFLGNINAQEFKQLTGLDVNNPLRPITNADFANYWKQKYQATSGETESAFNIPSLGGGSSQYQNAAAVASFAAAVNPAAAAALAVAGAAQGGQGGDVSTWTKWLEHQLVRGAVVGAGFLFLGTGLGLFALSAVFRSDVGRTVAGSYIGGAVAGRAARGGNAALPPPKEPDVEPVKLERVSEPPKGDDTPFLDIAPEVPKLGPPTGAEIETALSGLFPASNSGTENVTPYARPQLEPIFKEMEASMRHYRESIDRATASQRAKPFAENKRNLALEAQFAPKKVQKSQRPMELATAEKTTPTGRRKKGKDFLGETVLTASGRRKIAQGWDDFVGISRRAKAAELGATPNAVKRAAKKGKEPAPTKIVAESLSEFEGVKVGGFVTLKDVKGKGRTSEPLKVTGIWRDPKGVGVQVKGEKSGRGMFPFEELEIPTAKDVRRAKQKSMLERLGVIRDWTKPKK